jgi:hypothetical protein
MNIILLSSNFDWCNINTINKSMSLLAGTTSYNVSQFFDLPTKCIYVFYGS